MLSISGRLARIIKMKHAQLSALLGVLLAVQPAWAVMVQIPGQGIILPQYIINSPTFEDITGGVPTAMSASGMKIVAFGRVYQKDLNFRQGAVTKSINHISFAAGGQVCAGCISTVQVDIEGVSTSSGPPGQPDGVILGGGSASATLALSRITNNTWFTGMPNFTAPAVVNYGQLIAVVFSFSTYDSGIFSQRNVGAASAAAVFGPNYSTYNGITWASSSPQTPPNFQLDFSDGTVGTLNFSMPYNNSANNDVYNSSSNPNETGMQFELPFNAQIDQICASSNVANGSATGTLELTDGNTVPNVLASVALDGHQTGGTGGTWGIGCVPITVQNILRNTPYYLGWKATSANNVSIPIISVGAASSWDAAMGGGRKFVYVTRHGAAWSAATTTARPYMAIVVSAIDDGTGPLAAPE
jgi:hypothetical protein